MQVGIVEGIEIVPWANSLQYQNAVNFREGMEQLMVVKLNQTSLLTNERLAAANRNSKNRLVAVAAVESDFNKAIIPLREELDNKKLAYNNAHSKTTNLKLIVDSKVRIQE